MIGGTDIIIPVTDAEAAMDVALRAAVELWDRPVFEDADTGETFAEYRRRDLAGRREVLVYRDAAARAGWDQLGADPSLDGTMIHLIADDAKLTIAVDDVPNPSIRSYVDAVRNALTSGKSKRAG
jgi:hypothetical protein